jgi:copper chaperone NosL|tara:strand:- start:2460 stop:2900 length:441 start_codon:yes stop_codon:yes gene_type:complete
MKEFIKSFVLVLGFMTILSCNHSPKPIVYGNDGCHYCKMTIVDKIHGAELITVKGKVFKFDATECMLNYVADGNEGEVGSFLTNHYESPTVLISASEATFLISENLPSPMGAYLTAFEDTAQAEKIQAEKGGELYNWEALKTRLMK